jgi:hypothetical protein
MKESGTMTARSAKPEAVRDPEVEPDQRRLDTDRPREAAGERGGRVAKPRERFGQTCDTLVNPRGVQESKRSQHPREAVWHQQRRRGDHGREAEPGP